MRINNMKKIDVLLVALGIMSAISVVYLLLSVLTILAFNVIFVEQMMIFPIRLNASSILSIAWFLFLIGQVTGKNNNFFVNQIERQNFTRKGKT
tara:strand:- start:246 stop:527 length:282 start_codon:yes stop_codon:yes gene_type:complete